MNPSKVPGNITVTAMFISTLTLSQSMGNRAIKATLHTNPTAHCSQSTTEL